MKVARTLTKSSEVQANECTPGAMLADPPVNKFSNIQSLLLQAIEKLADYAAEDAAAREAIANLSVVLLDLNS